MEIDLSSLDLEQLKTIYEKADADLKNALLGGDSWKDVQDKRKTVTELAILMHKKRFFYGLSSPADTPLRTGNDQQA